MTDAAASAAASSSRSGGKPAKTCSVAVIGAGIVGAATACALARDGHCVTIFDPVGPAAGASFGNAGMISSGACVPIALPGLWRKIPGMLLDKDSPLSIRWRYLPQISPFLLRMLIASRKGRVEEISQGLAALLNGTQQAYVDLLGERTARGLIRKAGVLYTFASEASFSGAQFGIDLRRRRGIKFEVIDRAELRQLAPAIDPGHARALYFPDNAHATDPAALVEALVDRAERDGATFVRSRVDDLTQLPDRRTLVGLREDSQAFDKVVIATGAWSKHLARKVGVRAPLDAERGYHVMLEEPGVDIPVPMISVDHSIAVTPMKGGLRVTGMVEFAGVDAAPDWSKVDRIRRKAKKLLPHLNTEGGSIWMGPRPSLPDSLPVIGPAPDNPNVILAFGHGHGGLSFGGVTALSIAALVRGDVPALDLRPYSPVRFH